MGRFSRMPWKTLFLHTESTNAPAIHRQRHHQAPGWLKHRVITPRYLEAQKNTGRAVQESRGNINKKRPNPWKKTRPNPAKFKVSPTNTRHLKLCRWYVYICHCAPKPLSPHLHPAAKTNHAQFHSKDVAFFGPSLICFSSIILQMAR